MSTTSDPSGFISMTESCQANISRKAAQSGGLSNHHSASRRSLVIAIPDLNLTLCFGTCIHFGGGDNEIAAALRKASEMLPVLSMIKSLRFGGGKGIVQIEDLVAGRHRT